ncbi:MAG: lipid-A-disaccharide synthase, partial [Pontibacterium sp.]
FNLDLEAKLKEAGIPTVHYVSPSVWAWRRKRVEKIKRSTDLMLTLFPFEAAFYRDNDQRVNFVGHTLANAIRGDESQPLARRSLGLDEQAETVAIMPGSRGGELKYLARPFLETAAWLAQHRPDIQFVLPAANEQRYEQLETLISDGFSHLNIKLVMQNSRLALTASDAVLIASGTATLEALLSRRPMVVAYKMSPVTFQILSRVIKSPFVSLPNLLANERLVPEILQNDVCAKVLGPLVLESLDDTSRRDYIDTRFAEIHRQLAMNADSKAADAVMALLHDMTK